MASNCVSTFQVVRIGVNCSVRTIKLYIAGKVSKNSFFGTHYWRDDIVATLSQLTDYSFDLLDPTRTGIDQSDPMTVFQNDCRLIQACDLFFVYLSDDISVGGSQEILIAKYLQKPVIGLAPRGGKFNGSTKEFFGQVVKDYKDPFVFSTCDFVCETIDEVAATIDGALTIQPKTLAIIDDALQA